MPKDKLTDYSATNASNTDVGGVNIDEGMLPSSVNNAIRELMTHQANAFGAGTPLYVDETNNRVGVGTTSPSYDIDVTGDTNGSVVGRIGNANTGASTASVFQLATGSGYGRYVNLTTNYTSQYFQISNANINTGYTDFNTQIFRNGAGSEYARLDSDGLKFNGDTAAANALDDYEEGTFTPTSGVTLTNNYSKYTKIGRFVYINMDIEFTTSSSGSTAAINSLPFTSGDSYSTGVISYTTSGYPDSVPNLQGSSIYIRANNGSGNLSYANVSGKRFILSAFYVT